LIIISIVQLRNVQKILGGLLMADVKIKIIDDAPIAVIGETELLDGEGKTMKVASELHLCRCGLSNDKPFCDGAHQGKFESKVRA